MSTATMERDWRPHHHQGPALGRPHPTLDVQPAAVEAGRAAIDPRDESWRPFPYYGERPDDRPTLTGLIKSRLMTILGMRG